MVGLGRGALRRRVLRDARGLAPSVDLPWTPPWDVALASALVDLHADVLVTQADVADERTWVDDESGAVRRARVVESCATLASAADVQALHGTASTLREIAATLRAYDALGARL